MANFKININTEGGIINPLINNGIAGEDLFRGTLCYLNTDGKYYKADASNISTCSTELRITQEDIITDAVGSFIEQGTHTTLGLTVGERYYVSTTAGEYTTIKPSAPNIIRYIGTASSVTDLEFNPMDLMQESLFYSTLDSNLEIPNEWEENSEGITISQLQGKTPTQLIETLFFPTILAYITSNAYTSYSGQTSGTVEVGTSITQGFTVILNKGNINNGDTTSAGPVIGDLSSVSIILPDTSTDYVNNSPTGTTDIPTISPYIITQGTNTWTIIVTNNVGTTTYTDNKGGTATISSIENAKADTTRDNVTLSMTGVYKRFHYVGTENNSPTTSTGVRALTNSLLSTSNTGTWDVNIGSGASNAEFSFYVPTGKTHSVIDLGNLNLDITNDFIESAITVNDANGVGVNYKKYTRFAGALGYTNPTTFRITIS